jgi:hypothetical protein
MDNYVDKWISLEGYIIGRKWEFGLGCWGLGGEFGVLYRKILF